MLLKKVIRKFFVRPHILNRYKTKEFLRYFRFRHHRLRAPSQNSSTTFKNKRLKIRYISIFLVLARIASPRGGLVHILLHESEIFYDISSKIVFSIWSPPDSSINSHATFNMEVPLFSYNYSSIFLKNATKVTRLI